MAHDREQRETFDFQPRPLLNEQQEAGFARWIESELALLERRFAHFAAPFAGRLPRALLKRPGQNTGGAAPFIE